ncbi:MAG: hypothetical protein ACI8TP_000952 [Acidimicrobiales bacterium]|jgi:hypothetical protein
MGPDDTLRQPEATIPSLTKQPDQRFNREMARQLRRAADLLETQRADRHRVRAYRRAADELLQLGEPASSIYRRQGLDGLVALPGIGRSFALAIADLVEVGRWRWLDRLEGDVEPERLLSTVAGIGPGLATRIHLELGVETLEDLELAARNGRLAKMRGFGPKRVQSVKDNLAGRLGFRGQQWRYDVAGRRPLSVGELLDIDCEYRQKAAAGRLPTIVPSRFNPQRKVTLPVLHTARDGRHFTAVYSNTPLANDLGRTTDWVVIYEDAPDHGRWTVVTETRGRLTGQRVVRGWSDRCDGSEW